MNSTAFSISPKQVFPPADTLIVVGTENIPPLVHFILGQVTLGSTAVAGRGTAGHTDYIAPKDAVADQVVTHQRGTYQMTDSQWSAWKDQPDASYLAACIAEALKLKLV